MDLFPLGGVLREFFACGGYKVRLDINPCATPAKMQRDFASGLDIDKELNLLSEIRRRRTELDTFRNPFSSWMGTNSVKGFL